MTSAISSLNPLLCPYLLVDLDTNHERPLDQRKSLSRGSSVFPTGGAFLLQLGDFKTKLVGIFTVPQLVCCSQAPFSLYQVGKVDWRGRTLGSLNAVAHSYGQ
jgi:hypothetical protein